MLHALELENFKAFGKRARIPFAPITLIFGENSAGKSTILQGLNLLKQTLENRETGALLLPRTENGIVDLGSFQEMLFDHDLKRTLSIRVKTTVTPDEKSTVYVDEDRRIQLPFGKNKIDIEFSFKRPSLEEEVLLHQIDIYVGESANHIASFQPLNTKEQLRRLDSVSTGLVVACIWLTNEPEYWKPEFEWCKEHKEEILSLLKKRLRDLEHPNNDSEGKLIKNAIEFFSLDLDLETYISKRAEYEMGTGLDMDGFLPSGVATIRIDWITGLLRDQSIETFDVVALAIAAESALKQTLEALFPISPFRKPPERWYIFRGTSPRHVGYGGDLLPDLLFRRPELVKEANEWLKRLDMGYELEVKSVGTDLSDLFEVRLIDTRRKKRVIKEKSINVALSDVGYGISQLLPFIVQSLVSEKRIISIEQPEVHVHPKLQADLGGLLAEAIKEPRRNRFIIETHSEHLILRLQRLVYEGEIKPEDLSVIYVSRGPEGSEVQRLRLDEEGDFIDEWPNGFFPERLRELR